MANVQATHLWPSRNVPYLMSKAAQKNFGANIQKAIDDWNFQTQINLILLTEYIARFGITDSWIRFTSGSGRCSSHVGRKGGVQDIKCNGLNLSSLVHEIGHALGLQHEQTRIDRNSFVFIVEEQMPSGEYNRNYKSKIPPYTIPHGNYDCRSVMHYSRQSKTESGSTFAFFDKLPWGCSAIGPLSRNRNGRQTWLSDGDIAAINRFY